MEAGQQQLSWSLGTVPSSTDNVGLFYWGAGGNECTISSAPTVNNMFISPSSNPTLGSDFVVNGSILLQRDIDLSGRTITLGSSGYLYEGTQRFFGTSGTIQTTRTLNNITSQNIGGLGFVITSAANLGSTLITRGHTAQTAGESEGISRYYNVTPSTNTGLNATATYYYNEAELNGIEETDLKLFKSTDDGTSWTNMGGTVSAENNTVSLSGIDGFSRWTLGNNSSPLPVELNTFSAKSTKNLVSLNWETKTEVDNYGFEVERSLKSEIGSQMTEWTKIGFVPGSGNSNAPKSYSFKDNTPRIGKVLYRLKQIDNDGTFSYSDVIEVEVALPTEFKLEQNYPNPFNPTTKIQYQLPVNSHVKLELYSITGEKISTLVNDELEAGYYTLILNASELKLSSGVYFYRLITNEYTSIKKMLLLK
ncbi:MAG: T9SS type A sorting domain-containing protein [Ignavibacteriaceae bacterium]